MKSLVLRTLAFIAVVFVVLFVNTLFDTPQKKAAQVQGDGEEAAVPVLAQLPDFTLTDQEGKAFGTQDMRGHVTVIDFVFTSCPTTCPLLTRQMRELQKASDKWHERVRFVSITVDPEHDSKEVLKAYGKKFEADFSQWHFLTGDLSSIEDVIVKGFKTSISRQPAGPGAGAANVNFAQIAHSENFVVVDSKLQIRAYQTLTGEKEMKGMLHLMGLLL